MSSVEGVATRRGRSRKTSLCCRINTHTRYTRAQDMLQHVFMYVRNYIAASSAPLRTAAPPPPLLTISREFKNNWNKLHVYSCPNTRVWTDAWAKFEKCERLCAAFTFCCLKVKWMGHEARALCGFATDMIRLKWFDSVLRTRLWLDRKHNARDETYRATHIHKLWLCLTIA